jgi:hypothetical protein
MRRVSAPVLTELHDETAAVPSLIVAHDPAEEPTPGTRIIAGIPAEELVRIVALTDALLQPSSVLGPLQAPPLPGSST